MFFKEKPSPITRDPIITLIIFPFIFDALLYGLPIICMNVSGTPQLITDEVGIKIQLINPEQAIRDLSRAISTLAGDAELRKTMGEAAREKIRTELSWDAKGATISRLYQHVISMEHGGKSLL